MEELKPANLKQNSHTGKTRRLEISDTYLEQITENLFIWNKK